MVEAHGALASPQATLRTRAHAGSTHRPAVAAAAVQRGEVGAQTHRIFGCEHEEYAAGDLVVDDRLVVIADDVDAELHEVLGMQLENI